MTRMTSQERAAMISREAVWSLNGLVRREYMDKLERDVREAIDAAVSQAIAAERERNRGQINLLRLCHRFCEVHETGTLLQDSIAAILRDAHS